MTACLQARSDGLPQNAEVYTAWEGLTAMGWKIEWFTREEAVTRAPFQREVPVVGDLMVMGRALRAVGAPVPTPLDYPPSLAAFLGRTIERTTLRDCLHDNYLWPNRLRFIKPSAVAKLFTGFVLGDKDEACNLLGIRDVDLEAPVYTSEVVAFTSEYRIFVQGGDIVGVRHYLGNPFVSIDEGVARDAVRVYEASGEAPVAYAMDLGRTEKGQTLLVEVNDAWSLGCYGLDAQVYAQLLVARWKEMASVEGVASVGGE